MKLSSYFQSTTIVDFGVMLKFTMIHNGFGLVIFINALITNFKTHDLIDVVV
jgi:hypothetical protein